MLPSLSCLGSANGANSVLLVKPAIQGGGAELYTTAKAKAGDSAFSGPFQKRVYVDTEQFGGSGSGQKWFKYD